MKYIKNLFVCFWIAVMVASAACGNGGDTDKGATIDRGKLSFVLPDVGKVITYSASSVGEDGSVNDVVAIYVFDDLLHFMHRHTIPYSQSEGMSNGRQYSLSMTGSGERNFVFIQAPSGYEFPGLAEGSSIDVLTRAVTDPITGRLLPPFTMSNAMSEGNPYITVADIEAQTAPITVNMKRRVARFDIINEAATIALTGVQVSNAPLTGSLLNDGARPKAPDNGLYYDMSAPSELSNGGKSFYLYPTVLNPDNTGTVITIRTKDNGSSREKYTTIPVSQSVPIEANKRYLFTMSRDQEGELALKLTISEWSETSESENMTAIHEDIQIFLCMGQSNMVGYTDAPYDYEEIRRAYVYDPSIDGLVSPASAISSYNVLNDRRGRGIGVPYGFLMDMISYFPARKTAVVLAGYGGEEIADFLPESGTGYYSKAIAAVKAAAAHGGKIRGVLWHQGEADSGSNLRHLYSDKLKTIIESVRRDLNIPNLPFVAGEVMEYEPYGPYLNFVEFNKILNSAAAGMPGVYVVQSDGLKGQDTAHLNASDMVVFGKRYAAKVFDIFSGTAE
ncbi:MAG: FimB/Mfa2 family fimbrial subunit [Tannerellaceae bacterium]|nr:FimB/Mfa2 family fimbrial subunit [Tannerellaceae bacterium]